MFSAYIFHALKPQSLIFLIQHIQKCHEQDIKRPSPCINQIFSFAFSFSDTVLGLDGPYEY